MVAPTTSPEDLTGASPESQGVDPVSYEVRLLPESDTRQPVLGAVDLSLLARKNPDVDFNDWLNSYNSALAQKNIGSALLKGGVDQGTIDIFLEELRSPGAQETVSYAELKILVEKINKRQEAYDEASEEAENFKSNMIFDNVKDFLHEQVVEGFQTNPIATLLKVGLSLYLIKKVYDNTIGKSDTAKQWFWGLAGGVAGLYILNGAITHGDKGLTGLEHLGFTPGIDSPELKWFCEEAGIEKSRDRTSVLMRLTNVKIDTLADLYAEGNGQIDIGELLDDPSLTDKQIAELEKLNTDQMRTSLYETIGKMIKLAGVSSALELKKKYPGETLFSVIFQLSKRYNGQRVADVEDSVDSRISETDRQLSQVLYKMGAIDGVTLRATNDRLWMNGYPLAYVLEGGELKIKSPDNPDEVVLSIATTPADKLKLGLESFYKTKVKEAVTKAFTRQYTSVSGAKIEWSDSEKNWVVKGLEVPAKPGIGLAGGGELELEADFDADGTIKLGASHNGEVVTAENVETTLVNIALAKKIRENGPSCCRVPDIKIGKFDEASGRIEAQVYGSADVVLKYKEGKYILIKADLENEKLAGYYKTRMEASAEMALRNGLKDLKIDDKFFSGYNLIQGVDLAENYEFEKLYETKSSEMGVIFLSSIKALDQNDSDLEARIDSIRESLVAGLKRDLENIANDFNKFKNDPSHPQITKTQFDKDYIDRLQFAGVTSVYYREQIQGLTEILRSKDYAGKAYYPVKAIAMRAFFAETGHLAVIASPSAQDKQLVASVIAKIENALNDALAHGYSPDDTIWTQEFEDALAGRSTDDRFSSRPSTQPTTPAVAPTSPETTPPPASTKLEISKEALTTKEKAFDEYSRYVSAHFDSMRGLVDGKLKCEDISLWKILGLREIPSVIKLNLQWQTLLDFKRDEQLATLDRASFYADFERYSHFPNPADAIAGSIQARVDMAGLPQKTAKIRSLATEPLHEEKYFQMLEELMFIGQEGGVFEGATEDSSLDAQVEALERKASATTDDAEYKSTVDQLNALTSKAGFSGKREAYRHYLRGSFIRMTESATVSPESYVQAFGQIDKFSGTAWEASDAGLYSRVVSVDESFRSSGVHPSQIVAGYDVRDFMASQYRAMVQAVDALPLSNYAKGEQLEHLLETQKEMLTVKKSFWEKVTALSLNTDTKQKIGTAEQAVHSAIISLEAGADGRPNQKDKVELYRSTLMDYMYDQLSSGKTEIDGGDIRDHIADKAKTSGIAIDKAKVNIV